MNPRTATSITITHSVLDSSRLVGGDHMEYHTESDSCRYFLTETPVHKFVLGSKMLESALVTTLHK
eukprot:6147218-Amphidinium_carterae.1